MEHCDQGTLRRALDGGRLRDITTGLTSLPLALQMARDVAAAMEYLHEESILHGDLKASNVLLKSQSGAGAGPHVSMTDFDPGCLIAKVSDFGLSRSIDASATHVSSIHAGTLTHMSPELLLDGKGSKASDVYAYGAARARVCFGACA
ncbi:MAG: kinase-like domain-containing protein [Monoraphidium minutum]|nr:MAG: kinase-like domain-containing protein [Monoraphidium minutum]